VVTRNGVLLTLVLCAGCDVHRGPVVQSLGLVVDRPITLNDHRLVLHAADLRVHRDMPLVVYATGDRGWAGKDLDVYRRLVSWGYAVAGFDAHEYVTHLGKDSKTTTPGRVARDYETIITTARESLHLDADVRVVLVGVSRGADLAVVAAGQRLLRTQLTGVVAVGLTKEEEYVKWYRRIGKRRVAQAPEMVEVYEYLPRLGLLPLVVIQSTNDDYLPAASARVLFGADTDSRHLIAVDARNHSFAGARDQLYDVLQRALVRITAAGR
jgi:pimeloyl-ACP methyl ester carboxylesterase